MSIRNVFTLIVLLVFAPFAGAQSPELQVLLKANLTIAGDDEEPIRVAVKYRGDADSGDAVVTYRSPDGAKLRDKMGGCTLVMDATASSMTCTNPHFITIDSRRWHYHVSSDLFTDGKLRTFRVVGPVRQTVRYLPVEADERR